MISIVAMWRFTLNNGIVRGFHNKMEMVLRRTYNFRNFENYRITVMTLCAGRLPDRM
ncbi:transposase [Alteromonas macleodii]|uniref:transposase n=1 Tax=Alteromonas macleodii TaxID=28108 RepID=UPI00364C7468